MQIHERMAPIRAHREDAEMTKNMSIEQFDISIEFAHAQYGHWVRYDDHCAVVEMLTDEIERLREGRTDLHGALVRVVMEGEGCGPECSLEFHQWGIASMLKIARDALKRYSQVEPTEQKMASALSLYSPTDSDDRPLKEGSL
jgi:hypothetical protein